MGANKLNDIPLHGEELGRLNDRLQRDLRGFREVASILKEATGINLPESDKNTSLVASRMLSVLKRHQMTTYAEFLALVTDGDQKALQELVECLTTNLTDFFRESKHYDFLREILPSILKQREAEGSRELRVWCAAASTGQEPYSLAMTLLDTIPRPETWSIKFLATDIDTTVLKRASAGLYSEREMKDVNPLLRQTHFDPHMHNGEKIFKAKKHLRDICRFAQFNLMENPFPFEHPFEIVFCRNVLIYFDKDTAVGVVNRLGKSLRVGGYLFLGHTESGVSKPPFLESASVAVYKRKN